VTIETGAGASTVGAAHGTRVLSDPTPLGAYLQRSHDRHRHTDEGAIATYIPELGRADPDWFGVAATTLAGHAIEIGDTQIPFTIQSISKPLTYGLILDDLGEAAVRARIGVEPTGDTFNAITLAPETGLPLNPMVNAGAIVATGLVRPAPGRSTLETLLAGYSRFAGRQLEIDEAVYASERETGHRNRAIASLLKANGAIDDDPVDVVEAYFGQCAILVTTTDLAVIAATLANGGVNPVTGERAISAAAARAVLSVMASCGMYDGAGEWLYAVGMPAKSGVAGGIIATIPGQLGIATFSPRLDRNGNSVRGVRVCRDIVEGLGLHPYAHHGPSPSAIRTTFGACDVSSRLDRTEAERQLLEARGPHGLIVELHGHLSFLAADEVAWAIRDREATSGFAVEVVAIDLGHVDGFDVAATYLLGGLIASLTRAGIDVVLSGHDRLGTGIERLEIAAGPAAGGSFRICDDLDVAIETIENTLLGGDAGESATTGVPLAGHDLVVGLDAASLATLTARLDRRAIASGTRIIERGAPARELYCIVRGRVSVVVDGLGTDDRRRLSTLGPGRSFGEEVLFAKGHRTTDVIADTDVEVLVLPIDAIDDLLTTEPGIIVTLLRNLLRSTSAAAARRSREIVAIS
jgi:glutaminase